MLKLQDVKISRIPQEKIKSVVLALRCTQGEEKFIEENDIDKTKLFSEALKAIGYQAQGKRAEA